MKYLYIVKDKYNNNIIGYSKNLNLVNKYIELNNKEFSTIIELVNSKSVVKRLQDTEPEKEIITLFNLPLLSSETEYVYDVVQEEKSRIKFTVSDLKEMVERYEFSKKEERHIRETIEILESSIKRKRKLAELLNIKQLVYSIYSPINKSIIEFFDNIHKYKTIEEDVFIDLNEK